MSKVPVPPPVTIAGRQPFRLQPRQQIAHAVHLPGGGGLAVGEGRDVLQMAVIGLDARKTADAATP